jgi:hypothetical protein
MKRIINLIIILTLFNCSSNEVEEYIPDCGCKEVSIETIFRTKPDGSGFNVSYRYYNEVELEGCVSEEEIREFEYQISQDNRRTIKCLRWEI